MNAIQPLTCQHELALLCLYQFSYQCCISLHRHSYISVSMLTILMQFILKQGVLQATVFVSIRLLCY